MQCARVHTLVHAGQTKNIGCIIRYVLVISYMSLHNQVTNFQLLLRYRT
jgi:hypothetical protein